MQIGNTVCSSGLKITRYKSEEPRTPYAPTWDFSIGSTVVPLDVELLSKTCLKKEKNCCCSIIIMNQRFNLLSMDVRCMIN